jgi:hypothetical protein
VSRATVAGGRHTPRILLVGLLPGLGGMHLPRHLARVGFHVFFAGTEACMTSRSGLIRERHAWEPAEKGFSFTPFYDCVTRIRPDWVVPLDELASARLQEVGRGTSHGREPAFPRGMVDFVRRCLGDPQGFGFTRVRSGFHAAATRAAVAAPAQEDVAGAESLIAFAAAHGYPVILKRERSMGGAGVFVLESEAAVREICGRQKVGAGGTAWVVQSFVPGQLGMHAVFADRGRVVAQLSAVQLRRRSARVTAPSSVVRLCRHPAMAAACAAYVAATGASGFHGWDFQLEENGKAVMIEHNPRPISISHLGGLLGDDLCAALATRCGLPGAVVSPVDHEPVVTLFPDEWRRDPNSPMLHGPYHDAPWDDPALFAAVLGAGGRFL